MKKTLNLLLLFVLFTGILAAANTTSSSKGFMTDRTGGWWSGASLHYARQIITIDYTKGDGTSITLTAGCRFTNEPLLISTVTYLVPIIDSTGAATSDPITFSATGSYVLLAIVPQTADQLYVKIEYTGGTTATVDINHAPDSAQPGR